MRERPFPHLPLLDDMRARMRARHMSHRTEEAYLSWVRWYLRFHRGRHPAPTGAPEIDAFLTHLSVRRTVVREGKGDRDRVTMLPDLVCAELGRHLQVTRDQHDRDLRAGAGWVALSAALERKYPSA